MALISAAEWIDRHYLNVNANAPRRTNAPGGFDAGRPLVFRIVAAAAHKITGWRAPNALRSYPATGSARPVRRALEQIRRIRSPVRRRAC